jgi:hypothetical protein
MPAGRTRILLVLVVVAVVAACAVVVVSGVLSPGNPAPVKTAMTPTTAAARQPRRARGPASHIRQLWGLRSLRRPGGSPLSPLGHRNLE